MAWFLKISDDKMCLYRIKLYIFTRLLLCYVSFFSKSGSPSEKQVRYTLWLLKTTSTFWWMHVNNTGEKWQEYFYSNASLSHHHLRIYRGIYTDDHSILVSTFCSCTSQCRTDQLLSVAQILLSSWKLIPYFVTYLVSAVQLKGWVIKYEKWWQKSDM